MGVLAELRCAEGTVTDEGRSFVYTVALRAGTLRLKLDNCHVRSGARPDDLVAVCRGQSNFEHARTCVLAQSR